MLMMPTQDKKNGESKEWWDPFEWFFARAITLAIFLLEFVDNIKPYSFLQLNIFVICLPYIRSYMNI